MLDDAEKAINSLEEMPLRYPLVAYEPLASLGLRGVPVQNYIVFYVVREGRRLVVIERLLYGKRDWTTILYGRPEGNR